MSVRLKGVQNVSGVGCTGTGWYGLSAACVGVVTDYWRHIHNEELHGLYSLPNIIR
jgi:hypothetical protein